MAVTFGVRTARQGNSSLSTETCTTPASGDKLYALIYHSSATTITWNRTGWQQVTAATSFDSGGTGHQLWEYTGALSDFATHSPTSTGTPTWWCILFTLVGTGITIDQAASANGAATTSTNIQFPNTTAASAAGYVLRVGSWRLSGSTSTIRIDPPASHTERIDTNVQSSTDFSGDEAITSTSSRLLYMADGSVASGSTPGAVNGATNPSTAGNWSAGTVVFVESGAAPTITASLPQVGAAKADGFTSFAKIGTATSVRMKVSTTSDLATSPVFSSAQTPDAQSYVKASITGLSAATQYYYGWENQADGSVAVAGQGSCKTMPADGVAASFRLIGGSCAQNNSNNAVFTQMDSENADYMLMLGDRHYGDIASTTLSLFRTAIEGLLAQTNQATFYANTPFVWQLSDHDAAGGNAAFGASTGQPECQQVYRQMVPHHTLEQATVTEGIYHSFRIGRVWIIVLDVRRYSSDPAATDNSSKTKLGTTQKQWFKDFCLAHRNEAKVVMCDGPWTGTTADGGSDTWAFYSTERTELVNYFAANSIRNLLMVHGDMHAVAANDGSTSPGSIPVYAMAPLDQTASIKGVYTHGPIPASGTAVTNQYGVMQFTDTGSADISVTYLGKNSSGATVLTGPTVTFTSVVPAETLRPNAALTLTNFTGAFTDIDADPDTTPVTDAGLVPVVDP